MSRGRGRQGRQVVLAAVPPRTPLLDYYWTSRRVFKTQKPYPASNSNTPPPFYVQQRGMTCFSSDSDELTNPTRKVRPILISEEMIQHCKERR